MTFLRLNDLEINAYLENSKMHQSFEEEEDTEEDEFLTVNPSGSVLQPASNPYNKQKKIAEANETLFSEEVSPKSPQRVKFNKVEKRICYDYFGSSFESDSIKSYEDEESELESVLQITKKPTGELSNGTNGDQKASNYLQPQKPASKVVVTVSPKPRKNKDENSESESEDVCVGTVQKTEGDRAEEEEEEEVEEEVEEPDEDVEDDEEENVNQKEGKQSKFEEDNNFEERTKSPLVERKESIKTLNFGSRDKSPEFKSKVHGNRAKVMSANCFEAKKKNLKHFQPKELEKFESSTTQANFFDEIDQHDLLNDFNDGDKQNTHDSHKKNTSYYPCAGNHSGITIRITGADSIESVESESTESEVQIIEKYGCQNLQLKQDSNYFPLSIVKNQNKISKEMTFKVTKQTFILRGTKTTQNIRSPKLSHKEFRRPQQHLPKEESEKEELKDSKKTTKEKTERLSSAKIDKSPSKTKTNSKQMSTKSKVLEEMTNSKNDKCINCSDGGPKKVRPKSCLEKGSVRVRPGNRPVTAPAKRPCCQWGQPHLPEYNGLRSEYGLSAEQLIERKRHKMEAQKLLRQRREEKFMEEKRKHQENEEKFITWLEAKRKQAQMQFLRNQKIQADSGIKIYPAPTAHLKRTGAVRSRKLFKSQRKCVSLEEILNNASTHEKKTYRIYLGLSFE